MPTAAVTKDGRGSAVTFTPAEEHFLRAYADDLARLTAMTTCGLALAYEADLDGCQRVEAHAGEIIAKAERLGLGQLASAIGADKIFFLSHVRRVCESPEPHQAIKGLQLLARIHGLWDDSSKGRGNIAIILGDPQGKAEPKPVANLPFRIVEVPEEDVSRGTANDSP